MNLDDRVDSLKICGTVSLHELLLGSQKDVRFKPGDGQTELTLVSRLQSLTGFKHHHQHQNIFLHLFHLLDILADLSLKAVTFLLKLFDGAVLGKLIRCAPHLTLCQAAGEQLLHAETQTARRKKTRKRQSVLKRIE